MARLPGTTCARSVTRCSRQWPAAASAKWPSGTSSSGAWNVCGQPYVYAEKAFVGWPGMVEPEREADARQLATEARVRVRFEEAALALSVQSHRVPRRLVWSREKAERIMQAT